MKIEVINTPRGRRFLWIDNDSAGLPIDHTSERLSAPEFCSYETVRVHRANKELVSAAEICWAGTHGDCPSFIRMGSWGAYRQELRAQEFDAGDVITISPRKDKKPTSYFDRMYWSGLQILSYGRGNELYAKD